MRKYFFVRYGRRLFELELTVLCLLDYNARLFLPLLVETLC